MRNKGFSLIELMVVLILISFSISLIVPSLSRFSKAVELKGAAKKISGILRYCRSEAVNKGQVYQVLFDSNLREVRVQSMDSKEEKEEKTDRANHKKTYFLPDGIEMKGIQIASPQYRSEIPSIEFYPNGGSNGGAIVLDSQGRKGYKIKIHFLTGIVEVERSENFGK
jgi:type II secretion system protein H